MVQCDKPNILILANKGNATLVMIKFDNSKNLTKLMLVTGEERKKHPILKTEMTLSQILLKKIGHFMSMKLNTK